MQSREEEKAERKYSRVNLGNFVSNLIHARCADTESCRL